MKGIAPIMMIALSAMALALTGCASTAQGDRARSALAGETYTLNAPQAVLDTREIAAYRDQRAQWAADGIVSADPWWASRNDARLNLRPGGNAGRFTESLVYTHDRQYSSNGHVYNSYRRDAYGSSYTRIAE